MPILIISMKDSRQQKRPAIVFLHSTNKCKEWLRPLLEVSVSFAIGFCGYHKLLEVDNAMYSCFFQAYASRGYVAIAIDSRYHGERAKNKTTYYDVC